MTSSEKTSNRTYLNLIYTTLDPITLLSIAEENEDVSSRATSALLLAFSSCNFRFGLPSPRSVTELTRKVFVVFAFY